MKFLYPEQIDCLYVRFMLTMANIFFKRNKDLGYWFFRKALKKIDYNLRGKQSKVS